jgi:hypothetical protein
LLAAVWLLARSGLAALCFAAVAVGAALAQTGAPAGILAPGNAAVTGFSEAHPPASVPPGTDPDDKTFIDLKGPSLRVIDLQNMGGPPQAQLVRAPKPYTATAAQIGQVFAVALDDASPPNIYVAATSAYGLPIMVGPDRATEGAPGATFMPGLFGPPPGGPGSIWKIDRLTGVVSLFANVTFNGADNPGPALGGLAFDLASRSLFVADRGTGMIHRFALDGTEQGVYDHGAQGRPAAGLPAVAYDPAKRLDITNPQFNTEDWKTWGYAPAERLVFGLAVRDGRLYYAVKDQLQIWSVSIAAGAFGADARIEINVPPGDGDTEMSKILFDDQGRMVLAERPVPFGDYGFEALTQEAIAQRQRRRRDRLRLHAERIDRPLEVRRLPVVHRGGAARLPRSRARGATRRGRAGRRQRPAGQRHRAGAAAERAAAADLFHRLRRHVRRRRIARPHGRRRDLPGLRSAGRHPRLARHRNSAAAAAAPLRARHDAATRLPVLPRRHVHECERPVRLLVPAWDRSQWEHERHSKPPTLCPWVRSDDRQFEQSAEPALYRWRQADRHRRRRDVWMLGLLACLQPARLCLRLHQGHRRPGRRAGPAAHGQSGLGQRASLRPQSAAAELCHGAAGRLRRPVSRALPERRNRLSAHAADRRPVLPGRLDRHLDRLLLPARRNDRSDHRQVWPAAAVRAHTGADSGAT